MSNMMDILLADSQRLQERRATPPLDKPASRAERVIAECDKARVRYRIENPTADSAMVFGRQIGLLNGEVVRLCNELDCFKATLDTALFYDIVDCDELGRDVMAGFSYTAGEPETEDSDGEPECFELLEVWVNGCDIAAVLLERVAEQISDAVKAKHLAWLKAQGVAA